jgi:hypothetical protein
MLWLLRVVWRVRAAWEAPLRAPQGKAERRLSVETQQNPRIALQTWDL